MVLICVTVMISNVEHLSVCWPFVYLLWRMSIPVLCHIRLGYLGCFVIEL